MRNDEIKMHWFKGDTHIHTSNSDGALHLYELIDKLKGAGLDWAIITDHNYDTVKETYSSDGLTIIKGQEVTTDLGHINTWGGPVGVEMPYKLETEEDAIDLINKTKEKGTLVCLNHPFCSQCGFTTTIDNYDADCVEVWNTIQHSDNAKNMKWWHGQLLKGRRIPAVGGSDYHKDEVGLPIIAMPTTVIYSKTNEEKDVLDALKSGRSYITNSPNSSEMYLTIGKANVGDEVELNNMEWGEIKVTKLPPFFTLRVYNNDKIVYEHQAKKYEKTHSGTFVIKEKGFVRAEIDYNTTKIKKILSFAENKFIHCNETADMLFWAFTNPIWIV